ncbi:MAG: hypothetical protein RR521_05360 [Clostridia bacterium]
MTDMTPFHDVIRERIVSPGARYYADPWWDAEIKVFTSDMNDSLRFIQEACTDEELFWLGEVFDDIMEKTHSVEFLQCLRERVERVQNPEWKAEILEDIRTASEYINET